MSDRIFVSAPAKINLGLRVFPKRADGFHDIYSIFTTVPLYDELEICLSEQKNKCIVVCDGMDLPEENTFTKAYKAFCVLTGVNDGVCVKVKKHIPSGGGLGGGSSDASSFIQSVDSLFSTHLNSSSLHSIAGEVGSDVFFFTQALISGKKEGELFAAVVEGRGEKIRELKARDDFYVVLVFPEVFVSTKEAYALVDETLAKGDFEKVKNCDDFPEVYSRDVAKWNFVNSFTKSICSKYPGIAQALADVKKSGADFADMSGSGSTVFGIYSSKDKAEKAVRMLGLNWKTAAAWR